MYKGLLQEGIRLTLNLKFGSLFSRCADAFGQNRDFVVFNSNCYCFPTSQQTRTVVFTVFTTHFISRQLQVGADVRSRLRGASVTLQVKKEVTWLIGYSTKSAGADKGQCFYFFPQNVIFKYRIFSVY